MTDSTVMPYVCINGTSRDALFEQRCDVLDAIDKAALLLRAMSPHGRDYQTAPKGEYEKAVWQHQNRTRALESIRSSILEEIEHLDAGR